MAGSGDVKEDPKHVATQIFLISSGDRVLGVCRFGSCP